MINNVGLNEFVISCDDCGENEFIRTHSWLEVLRKLKELNYSSHSDGGKLLHYCRLCRAKQKEGE